ncbi:MAG: GDSL-type esterase/lipase family protein [Bacteroidota bacterium]
MRYLVLLLVLVPVLLFGQSTGQGYTPPVVVDNSLPTGLPGQVYVPSGDSVNLDYPALQNFIPGRSENYEPGDRVLFQGRAYQAVESTNLAPPSIAWRVLPERPFYDLGASLLFQEKAEAKQRVVIGLIGDSQVQTENRGGNRFRQLTSEEIGDAGQGYIPLDGGNPPYMNIENRGATIHNEDPGYGEHSLIGYAIELNTGDEWEFRYGTTPDPRGFADRITVFYLARPGDGTATINYGTQSVNINAGAAASLEKRVVVLEDTYGANEFQVDNVVGEVTITDVIYASESRMGLHLHQIGHGGWRYDSWLSSLQNPLNVPVLDSLKLDVVIIRLGTNDWSAQISLSLLADNIDAVLAILRNRFPNLEGMVVTPEDANLPGRTILRGEYVNAISSKANEYGFVICPLGVLIPNWQVWEERGYATDDVHSNGSGGLRIGDFMHQVFSGQRSYQTTLQKQVEQAEAVTVEPDGIAFGDTDGSLTSDVNLLSVDPVNGRMGINTANPLYDFHLPYSATTDWELTRFRYSPTDGLVWRPDNSGTENYAVTWNMANRKFSLNFDPTSGSGFEINGTPFITKITDYLTISGAGGFTWDGRSGSNGPVTFYTQGSQDMTLNLGTAGASEFKLNWGSTQQVNLMTGNFSTITFGVALLLNNVSAGSGVTSGLLYRQDDNKALRQMTWTNVVSRLDSEGIATDTEVSAIQDLVRSGTGSPEGAVSAPVGTMYLRSDGGAGTTLYVKESGTGNTGWTAK